VYVPSASINGVYIISTRTNAVSGTITGDFAYPGTYGHFIAQHRERISGRVVSKGAGAGGVTVTLSNGSMALSIVTDDQGRYFFYAPAGRYSLSFSGRGRIFSPQNVDTDVADGPVVMADTEILSSIWVDPSSITPGQSAVLHWDCADAAGVSIDQGIGEVASSGTLQVAPAETTTYTMTVTGSGGGTMTVEATVMVLSLPTVNITADASTIVQGQATTLSWTSDDAETLSMDQGIGVIELSGSLAVSPSETTTYTITASGPGGTVTASFTLTVTAPLVTITSPHAGESIPRPDVMVTGTIHDSLSRDPAVTVNGRPAMVYENTFVANHVPLQEGEYILTAIVRDNQGNSAETSIDVQAMTGTPYFSLLAGSESGYSPLDTDMKIDIPFMPETFSLDADGPGSVEYLEGSSSTGYKARLTAPGIYYLTARLTDGSAYRDTVGIVVYGLEDADARIREKWNGMKSMLINGDTEGALRFFTLPSEGEYREIFTLLGSELPLVAAGMEDIEKVYIDDEVAKYRIKRDEVVGGVQSRITHYIYFARDAYGNWYIDSF
jgi:hypothetical protein